MNKQFKCSAVCRLLTVGIGLGVFAHIDYAFAELSEIDGFEQALAADSKEGVLDFVRAFPSSHLVIDLFELLPPDLAAQVCADLPGGISSAGRRACGRLQEAIALAPAAGGSAAEESAADDSAIQTGMTGATATGVNARSQGSGDKQQFLIAGPTNDTSTDASISARRDGIAADDTADDTAGSSTGSSEDDTTDTAVNDDTADTTDTVADATGAVAGSFNEDGGSTSATSGGNGSDGGTGGSTDGGAEKGGGGR